MKHHQVKLEFSLSGQVCYSTMIHINNEDFVNLQRRQIESNKNQQKISIPKAQQGNNDDDEEDDEIELGRGIGGRVSIIYIFLWLKINWFIEKTKNGREDQIRVIGLRLEQEGQFKIKTVIRY